MLEKFGKDLSLQGFERFRVAEKTGYADEHVRVKQLKLLWIAPEKTRIIVQRVLLV